MDPSQIDLSGGLVPAGGSPPPIDLSGGIVPAPAAPTQPPSYMPFAPGDPFGLKKAREQVKGFVKGAMSTAAGAIDIGANPLDPGNIEPGHVKDFRDLLRAHSQPNNPEQEKGDFVEAMSEFLPFMGEKAETVAARYGTKMELAKFAEKYPKVAALFNTAIGAARGAVEQGTQTYVKSGEDPEKTAESAKTGGIMGGAGSFLAETLPGVAKAIGNTIESLRPGETRVAGARFETKPGTDEALLRNLKDVRQDPATQAVDEALGNIGKTGVANSVRRTNAMRAPEGEIIPPARRLPGQTGFKVGPAAEPTPVVEGQTAFDPGKQQTGTRVVEGKGPGKFDLPQYSPELADAEAERAAEAGTLGAPEPQPEPVGSHREPTWQYRNAVRPGSPEPGTDTASGPGVLLLTDQDGALSPARARQQQAQYERIMNDPQQWDELGVREQQRIEAAHRDISDQLGRYDNFAASQPHFPLHDPLEMMRATDSLGDAGAQLKAAHGPFWTAADEASGKQFSNLRDEEARLRKQIYGENPTGRLDELRQQLRDNQQAQMDFFDKYRTTVNPQDWARARSGYQDGIVLSNLDDMLQRKFGGIERDVEQRGLRPGNRLKQRVFQPGEDFNEELRNFYNGGFRDTDTNRQVLLRTIGQDHMDAIHDLGLLFKGNERMERTMTLRNSIASTVNKHYHGIRGYIAGGMPGLYAATATGRALGETGLLPAAAVEAGSVLTGPAITGTIAGTRRYIVDRLISDPEFLKQFSYAIRSDIPTTKAATLLAARIIAQMKNQPLKQPKPQPEPTGAK